MSVLAQFHKAQIAKVFSGYQEGTPFPGKVHKVDTTGTDDKPFKIHYDDGDKEWVTLTELASILVDAELKAQAQHFVQHGVPADSAIAQPAKGPAGNSRKRQQPEAGGSAPAAAAGGAKKSRGAAAAAAADAPRRTGKDSQQAAAAAGAGSKPSRASGRAGAAAAAAAGAAADSAAVSPSEFDDLIRDVCQAAPRHAEKLLEDAKILRAVYKGPGAASLPKMAQAVCTGAEAAFTIYGSSRGNSLSPAGPRGPIDYKTESQEVLKKLQEQMDTLPAVHRKTLTRVRVYLRNVEEGLPGFKEAWNAWVGDSSLPVLTILQGSGPFTTAGVVLEANAYMAPN